MKKIIVLSLILTIIIVGIVYIKKEDDFKISEIDGVNLEIKEGTLSKTSATIVITDTSNEKHLYGLEFEIQKLIDGKWKKIKSKK